MNPALIEKFFRKDCTPQEAEQVALYLKANPDVLEKYISIEEWQATGKQLMPGDFWDETWAGIQKKNRQKHLVVTIKRITSIAASLIIVASAIWLLNPKQKAETATPVIAKAQLLPLRKSVTNTTNKVLSIVLEDSSVIDLSPQSTVQYDVPFPLNKRDIVLEGEAVFHVAKNKKKPFTVYAGALATTALGTIFSVNKSSGKNIISVKLFRGKIVVHSTDNNLKGWNKDVYLFPGEELKFNEQFALLAIEKTDAVSKPVAPIKVDKTNKKIDSLTNQLTFNNTSLPEVMNKLAENYNVIIKYDTLLIGTMKFTGVITKNDSLPVILKAIGEMNDLEIITNDSNEYIISKHNE